METTIITDTPPFHMGTISEKTRLENAKRRKRKERAKLHPAPFTPPAPLAPLNVNFSSRDRWCILPNLPPGMGLFLFHAGKTIVRVLAAINKKKRSLQLQTTKDLFTTPMTLTVPIMNQCVRAARVNQRLRVAFGALARRWLSTRLKRGNEEDLLTGEIPSNPITLVDWKSRTKYSFDPKTIMKDMVARLHMSTCVIFPKPALPRNPYTNVNMSIAQFYSVLNQLRRMGHVHWALEALLSCGYDAKRFESEMYMKLRLNILRKVFLDPNNSEGDGVLLDFIEDEYSANSVPYPSHKYTLAFRHVPQHKHIMKWKSLYYRKDVLRAKGITSGAEISAINKESLALCELGDDSLYDDILKHFGKKEAAEDVEVEVQLEESTEEYDFGNPLSLIQL